MEKSIHQASDAFLAEVSHRFQVVSRIAVLIKQDYKLADAVHTAASAHFLDADGSWRKNSVRTLYRWYSAFSAGGIEALKPQERQRNKPSSVISDNLLNFFKELKENDPVVSIPDMIRQGEYQHMITPQDKPDRTTLWRTLNRLGVDTGRSRTVKKKRDARRFAYPHRMDMMICDGNFEPVQRSLKESPCFFWTTPPVWDWAFGWRRLKRLNRFYADCSKPC